MKYGANQAERWKMLLASFYCHASECICKTDVPLQSNDYLLTYVQQTYAVLCLAEQRKHLLLKWGLWKQTWMNGIQQNFSIQYHFAACQLKWALCFDKWMSLTRCAGCILCWARAIPSWIGSCLSWGPARHLRDSGARAAPWGSVGTVGRRTAGETNLSTTGTTQWAVELWHGDVYRSKQRGRKMVSGFVTLVAHEIPNNFTH